MIEELIQTMLQTLRFKNQYPLQKFKIPFFQTDSSGQKNYWGYGKEAYNYVVDLTEEQQTT